MGVSKQMTFQVTLVSTPAAEQLGLNCNNDCQYTLNFLDQKIQLRKDSKVKVQKVDMSWPYDVIRRFGRKGDEIFVFESGRRGPTGEGEFRLKSPRGQAIFELFRDTTERIQSSQKNNEIVKMKVSNTVPPEYANKEQSDDIYSKARRPSEKRQHAPDPAREAATSHYELVSGQGGQGDDAEPEVVYSRIERDSPHAASGKIRAPEEGYIAPQNRQVRPEDQQLQRFITQTAMTEYAIIQQAPLAKRLSEPENLYEETTPSKPLPHIQKKDAVAPPPPLEHTRPESKPSSKKKPGFLKSWTSSADSR